MNSITPTIGRKVWFWCGELDGNIRDPAQAFDASVAYAHGDGAVTVSIIDHAGKQTTPAYNMRLRDYEHGDRHGLGRGSFCTWMPYQMGQANKPATT